MSLQEERDEAARTAVKKRSTFLCLACGEGKSKTESVPLQL